MNARPPIIFISATSNDLASIRLLARDAILDLSCHPLEQSHNEPSHLQVIEMLRQKIGECDAVVHIVGLCYGTGPREANFQESPRSYTQLEHAIARELGKPIYTIICSEDFPFDKHEPEAEAPRQLQIAYRNRRQSSDTLFEPVSSKEELRRCIYRLNIQVDQLKQQIASLNNELQSQRQIAKSFADAFTAQSAELAQLKLSEEQLFERAIQKVATQEGIQADDLKRSMQLFVDAVRGNHEADFMDRALADFAEKRFTQAAQHADNAVADARTRRLAAAELKERAAQEEEKAKTQEREALVLKGDAHYAKRQYQAAHQAYTEACQITDKTQNPLNWAQNQFKMARAAAGVLQQDSSDQLSQFGQQAIDAYQNSLEVSTREQMPQQWAMTQSNMGILLGDLGKRQSGEQATETLEQAKQAYLNALEVSTREQMPQDWAMTQNNLGTLLQYLGKRQSGEQAAETLEQAKHSYLNALLHQRADAPRLGKDAEQHGRFI